MSVVIGTPCYGGQMHVGFFRSCMAISDLNIPCDFLVTEGESLVSRARNNIVATFLNTDFETLAMIDADIEIQAEDFMALYFMRGVRGAAVAMKTQDHQERLSCFENGQVKRAEMPSEPFRVAFLGSAVLFIPRYVFMALIAAEKVSEYEDPIVGRGWDFFPVGVRNNTYLSEDYGFCELCRQIEEPIYCHPDVKVKHYGSTSWLF